ncbi:MAG TPA: enoyl-CoA hydratase [Blastocatellia bacterium]|jgi:enoyl-CoA hydratase/carnithine racemase|nr:enoyl-CoA hydratase [Blastocatellia bacterium]
MAPEPSIILSLEDHHDRGRVARIVIDYRARLNILNSKLITQLTSAIDSLRVDERLRALILTGAGDRAFIGGADLNEMAELDEESARVFITRLHEACSALRQLPVPVIARISGYCLGAGLEVAASCDLRVASEHSSFGMPEVRVGIPSVIEAALLPRLVGWGMAARLIYTGETISAQEAAKCGLIESVVPEEQLDEAVNRWVEAILEAGPRAVRLQKALLRQWETLSLDEAIERGIESFAEAYRSDEPLRLMKGFLQRKRERICD